MGYRRYVRILLVFLVAFTAYNYLEWELYTRKFFEGYNTGVMGDLARMGYLDSYAVPKAMGSDLHRRHLEYNEYRGQAIDVVTIGDSFAFGIGGGPNQFFQDYIASHNDFTVLNLVMPEGPSLESIWRLINSGFIERIKPRYVLLQSIERSVLPRYGDGPADVTASMTGEDMDTALSEGAVLGDSERRGIAVRGDAKGAAAGANPMRLFTIGFINPANWRYPAYGLLYRYFDNPLDSMTCLVRLDRPLFDTANPDSLLFLRDDRVSARKLTPARVAMLNQNMNMVADALGERGVGFYFMPVVDKFNLYYPYFRHKEKIPRSMFFELLRAQERRYGLIDTEAILSGMLAEGVRDVFHQDDTHWNYKAPDRIFSTFRFEGAPSQKD